MSLCHQPRNRPAPWKSASVLVALLLLSSCARKENADVLATVGPRHIRAADLRAEVERRYQRQQPVSDKQTLLQEMIDREALLQRARAARLDQDPQTAREIENLLLGKLTERDLTPRLAAVQVSAEEMQAEYDKNRAKYTQPAKVRLAVLFLEANIKSSPGHRAETRARLLEARQRMGPKPAIGSHDPTAQGFGPLAVNYSDDQASRYRGGDIGWLDAGTIASRWPKAVLETGYGLEKGTISDVLEAENGFYLVMKTDYREATVTAFTQVEPALRRELALDKRQAVDAAFRQESARLAGVTIHATALRVLDLPPPSAVAQVREKLPPQLPGIGVVNR